VRTRASPAVVGRCCCWYVREMVGVAVLSVVCWYFIVGTFCGVSGYVGSMLGIRVCEGMVLVKRKAGSSSAFQSCELGIG
jgi:hypothetical protein